jgi:citrate synthase
MPTAPYRPGLEGVVAAQTAISSVDTEKGKLAEYKSGRSLQTNLEFYTALLLHGVGFPTPLFTPMFALGRVAGWTAHCLDQVASNRPFGPQSTYIGARNGRRIQGAEQGQDSKEVSGD